MRAGKRDRRVLLQSRTLTANALGEQVPSYADLGEEWAEKIDLRGREYFAAAQVQSDVTTRWRIPYRSDMTVLHRLVYDGRSYDINHIAEIGRRAGLELFTKAMTS